MYVNPNVKKTKRVFPMQGKYDYHRYDMNENPEGLPREFVDAVLQGDHARVLTPYSEPTSS